MNAGKNQKRGMLIAGHLIVNVQRACVLVKNDGRLDVWKVKLDSPNYCLRFAVEFRRVLHSFLKIRRQKEKSAPPKGLPAGG